MVLLVATGTVCLLTNLLVLVIMFRQSRSSAKEGGRLCLRYRVVYSQALVGVLSSAVTIYPLKVRIKSLELLWFGHALNTPFQLLSLSLLDPAHSPSLLSSADASFFTSRASCLLSASAVPVASLTSNAAHAFILYLEQALYATNITAYMTLICSPRLLTAMLASAWAAPIAIAAIPLMMPFLSSWDGFCYLPVVWSAPYAAGVAVVLGLMAVAAAVFAWRVKLYGKPVRFFRRSSAQAEDSAALITSTAEGGSKKQRRQHSFAQKVTRLTRQNSP